jgi:two-component system, OmpR family, response regulator
MHLPFPFHNRARHPHVSPDTTVQMGRHHVLLVGPATLVPLLHSALATEGPHVDATDTAWLGRALAARYAYDLIVVDRPSDAEGRAMCGRIRAAGIATPILLLGTEATSDTIVCGLAAGADNVLRKPVTLARLRAQLLALLHQRGRAMVVVTDPREGASDSDDLLVLTTEEYTLLQYRVRQGGTTLQPGEIAAPVWGENVTWTSTEDRWTGHDRDDT